MVLEEKTMEITGGDEEEAEYESDPEEAPLSLTMRRKEASDDEEGDRDERETVSRVDLAVGIDSDVESDGQGGAPGYDDEEDEEEEVQLEEEEEYDGSDGDDYEERERGHIHRDEIEVKTDQLETGGDGHRLDEEETSEIPDENRAEGEGEKKENEPFSVPTGGAFYMHDDRFRGNGGGRNRRPPGGGGGGGGGGKKLWESKDNRKWGHDKFEELNIEPRHFEKQERGRGHYRGRGKKRGTDRGYVRGDRSRTYDDNNSQNHVVKTVRGRGPRRYESIMRNKSEASPNQDKLSGKSHETILNNNSSGRVPSHTRPSNVKSDLAPSRKHVTMSSLSSASPPFYPSGSSNQDILVTQRNDVQAGTSNRNLPLVQDRQYTDKSIHPVVGKLTSLQLQSSGSSPVNSPQSLHPRAKGRGSDFTEKLNYQPISSHNQVNRGSSRSQLPAFQQKSVSPSQPVRVSTQQQGTTGGSQSSFIPKGSSRNSSEYGEAQSPPGSNKSRPSVVGKEKENVHGGGRGSYRGAHVIGSAGSMGAAQGDQNFPGTPALLPVMQFGGQHPGGIGVPTVGMALPGYVAPPQLGFGSSEMTWVPVLPGGNGALGAPYCSPYLAVESGYYGRQSEQTSPLGVSNDASPNESTGAWNPPQRAEVSNEEFAQRQNKPRRYSEMNFGQ